VTVSALLRSQGHAMPDSLERFAAKRHARPRIL
jgi:hypothetical protein